MFLAKEPLNSRKLAQLANLADGTEARTLVRSLNRLYDAAHRAFRVEEISGGYQLLTRGKFADWVRRVAGGDDPSRLSTPAMETLAIIAYRQPVPRADVEAIRGVNCGEIIRQLMDRDLVQIRGRSEDLGRPFLYGTTSAFLRTFGFRSIDDLPRQDEFRKVEAETDASAACQVDDQKETSVSITLAPSAISQDASPADYPGLDEPSLLAMPQAQAPPIEDEEDELYEGEDEEELEDDVDDDYDEDWDEDDLDDDDDELEEDDLDEEEDNEWEEVEDDDEWEDDEDDLDEDEDDFDDDDEEDDESWGDDEE